MMVETKNMGYLEIVENFVTEEIFYKRVQS